MQEPYRRVCKQRTVDQWKYPNGKQNWTAGYLQYNTNISKGKQYNNTLKQEKIRNVKNKYKFPDYFAQPKRGTNHNNKYDPNLQHSKDTMGQVT